MMRYAILTVLAVLVAQGYASDVLEYTDSDFQSKIAEKDVALVEFFAPWCGHCKRLAPQYEEAATILKDNDPPVPLIKVDCTEKGKETCGKYGVSGYPTLKIFRNGEFSQEYSGPREGAGIVKYMRSQVGPVSKEAKTVGDVNSFIEKDEVGVVGYFTSDDSPLKATFLKVANKLREKVRFAHSVAPEVIEKFGKKDNIVLYRAKNLKNKFEPDHAEFDGSHSDDKQLETFINKAYHGLVGHRTGDTSSNFEPPFVIAYFKVDYKKNPKGTNYWRNRILKVAIEHKDKGITFGISDKDEFTQEINEYGFEYVAGDKPVVAAKNAKNQKFVLQGEFSIESFNKFVQDFHDGKLEPYLKSEAIPKSNDGPVKVGVAKNFDELVINNDKDVLLEFYAPWCGHCKKLAPVLEELGKELAEESNVVIVKFDATANDVPAPFQVHGFPTLFWLPKGKKTDPQRYEGGREKSDFITYISKHSTDGLKGWDRNGKKSKSEL